MILPNRIRQCEILVQKLQYKNYKKENRYNFFSDGPKMVLKTVQCCKNLYNQITSPAKSLQFIAYGN